MKKLSFLFAILMIAAVSLFAQAPQKFSYQAVVRNANNQLVTSQAVGVRVSILQGGVSGTVVYMETQTAVTNTNGLITLQIGGGNVLSGNFATIDWSEYLAVFGIDFATTPANAVTAGDLWKHIYSIVKKDLTEVSQSVMEKMLERGTLSSALYKALGDSPSHEAFVTEYKKLADCLAHNRLYGVSE